MKNSLNYSYGKLNYIGGLALLLVATLGISGCKTDPAFTQKEPAGVYKLVAVDGKPLPAMVSHDGTPIEVRSGTMTFREGGACATRTVFVPPSGKELAKEVSATYTREGHELTMKWTGAGMTTATLEGDALRMNNEGIVFTYSK